MANFLIRLLGDAHGRTLRRYQDLVSKINSLEPELIKLSDELLRERSLALKEKVKAEGDLNEILPEAFALGREAAKRTLGQRHFDVQLIGGMALHEGKIAQMLTGEGKTLAATSPAYLNALLEKGVHIVTVNDYLARRDAVWMGQIYHFLGLSVSCLAHEQSFLYDPNYRVPQGEAAKDLEIERDTTGSFKIFSEFLRPVSRREAYQADITYGTNHEFGFDYLRDNLAYRSGDIVQGEHYFAIVDEVDSILIDEARTPLIISMPDEDSAKLYREFTRLVPRLSENQDYNIDEKMRAVTLTDEGIEKIEKLLGRKIYEEGNLVFIHHLEEALKAHFLFRRDRDYIVKDGEVILVDEFTGRLMPGRRYSGGLHQALEAKEGVFVKEESRILATITIQNYFRMYQKLAGMTGTAATSAEEFHKVYNLDVVIVPPNKPMIRKDLPDKIFQSEKGKFKALVAEIKERHRRGQPVLVGTISIEKNEYLARLLWREGIRHEVLNAKNHEREGAIIAQAGRIGAVTVATNMAGRGVDIILGGNPPDSEEAEKIRQLGGLHVIGTERHEARRIDNQLRGRAGRQGDPGSSQFFVSLEDYLMRAFGSERIKSLMRRLGIPEDEPIEQAMVSKAIAAAQAKIEGLNFDLRKHVLEYDDVLNKQRDTIYRKRRQILLADAGALRRVIKESLEGALQKILDFHFSREAGLDTKELAEIFASIFPEKPPGLETGLEAEAKDLESLRTYLSKFLEESLTKKEAQLGEGFQESFRILLLRLLDTLWMTHLETMENLRDSVRLRSYGQRDPLVEYKSEGFRLYRELLANFDIQVLSWIFRI